MRGRVGDHLVRAFASPYRVIVSVFLTMQWLQVSTKVWMADVLGVDLSVPQFVLLRAQGIGFPVENQAREAVVLGLVGVAMVLLGTRVLAPRLDNFRFDASDLDSWRLFAVYLVLFALSRATGPVVGGGFAQPLLVLGSIRLTFAFLILLIAITRGQNYVVAVLAVAIELFSGILGFFAGFRDILFVGLVALIVSVPQHWKRVRIPLFAGLVSGVLLATAWQSIKGDYRKALNAGTATQTVSIDINERLNSLEDLAGLLDADKWADGFVGMCSRVSYNDILAQVLDYVPSAHTYENGALWQEAINVVLTPRVLFADKPNLLSDSERTKRYTGQSYASDQEGTSISMGYVADSYVDFGVLGVLVITFALGVLYSFLSRRIVALANKRDTAFVLGILVVMLSVLQQFEISNVKLLPGLLWAWIVCSLFTWQVWPRLRLHLTKKHVSLARVGVLAGVRN